MKKLFVGCWLVGLRLLLAQSVVGALAARVAQAEMVEYRDYDASTGTFTNAVRECTLVTAETRTLADGWYAVQGKVTIPEGARLVVKGTAHLVLCDGANLSVERPANTQAAVMTGDETGGLGESATLVIYGQELGTGVLVAVGGVDGPDVVGDAGVAVTVRAILGLRYELRRAETLDAESAVSSKPPYQTVASTVAEGTWVTLEDAEPPADKAFYWVEVSVP